MATKEIAVHPNVQKLLIQAKEMDTMLVQRPTQGPLRVLRNPHAEKVAEMENNGASLEELLPLYSGQRARRVCETGEGLDEAFISSGEVVGLIHNVVSVKEIMDEIVTGARAIYEGLKPD
jgi:nitronate monooxygenase